MSCTDIESPQTEFEFFQSLINKGLVECAGPVTTIGFTNQSFKVFVAAMVGMDMSEDYLDRYDLQVLDSAGSVSLTMCPKHWIQHVHALSAMAVQWNTTTYEQLAYYTFRIMCLTVSWDYKEILNYSKTVNTLET